MATLELRGELIHSSNVLEMDLFILDHEADEYLIESVSGTAELLYLDDSVCARIQFDEYFGMDTGAFKISFWNTPDYPLKGVRVKLSHPQEEQYEVTLEDALRAKTHTSGSYIDSFAKPLEI